MVERLSEGVQPIRSLHKQCYDWWSFKAPFLGFVFYNPFSTVQNNVQDIPTCHALRERICNHVTVVAPYEL
eukprot:849093-Prorocentrum_lima.AAC.1